MSALFLITGHAIAAEPAKPAATPAKPPGSTPAKPAPPVPVPVPVPVPAPAPPAPAPKPGDAPPGAYYIEPGYPAPPGGATAPPASAAPGAPPTFEGAPPGPPGPPPPPPEGAGEVYEPMPPGAYLDGPVYEPPPPPEPHHIAPRTALVLGLRLGWFIPFGSAWARSTNDANVVDSVPWRNYATSGPMVEFDVGARLARNYMVFALWERAQLGAGNGDSDPGAIKGRTTGGTTDFWGVGIRATSDADHVGFVTELAIGYRRARAKFDGGELQFTNAPFEARLGVGADVRINPVVTLSPLFTLGVGAFGDIDKVSGGTVSTYTRPNDSSDGHAWCTLSLGGSFDLLGSR